MACLVSISKAPLNSIETRAPICDFDKRKRKTSNSTQPTAQNNNQTSPSPQVISTARQYASPCPQDIPSFSPHRATVNFHPHASLARAIRCGLTIRQLFWPRIVQPHFFSCVECVENLEKWRIWGYEDLRSTCGRQPNPGARSVTRSCGVISGSGSGAREGLCDVHV